MNETMSTLSSLYRPLHISMTRTIHPVGQGAFYSEAFINEVSRDSFTAVYNYAAVATVSNGIVTAKKVGSATITAKAGEKSATCSIPVVATPVTSVTLDRTSAQLKAGETVTITATVKPDDATDKAVTWSTSDASVATVSNGVVTAVKVGTATIIATTVSGGFSATCEIVAPELEHIDLGLSVEWATYNIGARNPEETGDFYAWGETASKSEYNWTSYYYCNGTEITLTKYCTSSTNGNIDNVTTLDARDDVAQVRWGINWRMPTKEEFDELISECTWSWTILNNVYGYCITGPNHNSIFLPVTGYIDGSSLKGTSRGYYWSSTLDSERPTHGKRIIFNSDSYVCAQASRYYGFTVRPVYQ